MRSLSASLRPAAAPAISLAALMLAAGSALAQGAASFETPEYFASRALAQVNASEAYALGLTGKGVLIGIADSGLDSRHSEFLGRVLPGYDFLRDRPLLPGTNSDFTPHGTHVTGIAAAARDGQGMHGVAFAAQVVPAKLGALGGLDLYFSTPWPFLAAQGVSVINASYGIGGGASPLAPDVTSVTRNDIQTQFPKVLDGARGLADAGILMVVANGNASLPNPDALPALPHLFPELKNSWLAVGAVDANNVIAGFSNRCGVARDWCLVAPGVDIYSTLPILPGPPAQMRYGLDSGTSMAAPVVTGAAALVKEAFPWFAAPELQQTLLTTATDLGAPGVDDVYGWGLLNVGKAVRGPAQFVGVFDTDTKGWSGTFSNDIAGAGGLVKRGEGSLTLSGRNSYAGGTAVLGGTLVVNGLLSSDVTVGQGGTLRGTGLIVANLASEGMVRPGNSPGTLLVAGANFGPSSRLVLDIDGRATASGAGSYSRLAVLGPTAVTAGGRLVPVLRGIAGDAGNAFTPTLGESFEVLVASGGIAGSFVGLDQPGEGLAAGTRFDALYREAGLSLVVTPSAYAGLAGLSANGMSVAQALDAARPAAGVRPDAAHGQVFDALYQAAPATLGQEIAGLSGRSHAAAGAMALSGQQVIGAAIDRRLTTDLGVFDRLAGGGNGYAALAGKGPVAMAPQGLAQAAVTGRFWGQGLYGFGRRSGDADGPGGGIDMAGALVGLDVSPGEGSLFGGALGFLRSRSDATRAQAERIAVDGYSASLYGGTTFGRFTLRGSFGASYSRTEVDRTITLGPVRQRAHGEADGYGIFGTAMAGYRLATLAGLALSPEAGLSVNHIRRDGLTEQGAGAFGLSLRSLDATSVRTLAGIRLATPLGPGDGLRLDLKAYWAHELGDARVVQQASLLGAGFVTRGAKAGRDGAVVGASLAARLAPSVELIGSYDGDLRRGAMTHRFSLAATTRW
ncbi:S8 family serine peptidase [Bosea sp. TWI1241]|uniref:S8 family serine peptidase n=1 Tax=Bosea sp. TWI1241 TaxID=3148904 RepID=UPI003207B4AA